MSAAGKQFDVNFARSQFPGVLSSADALMDNAGGSQVASSCIALITDALSNANVQLGASYGTSKITTDRVHSGFIAAQHLVNAEQESCVILGSSTTQLMSNLSHAIGSSPGQWIKKGDEIIVTNVDHEANVGCWVRLAQSVGAKVKFWKFRYNVSNDTVALRIDDLKELLSSKTKLVCFTHCSNILGSIMPVQEISELVHSKTSALVIVDGVGYAPHRAIDVQKLGIDFYAFSFYKVFGPHLSMLYCRSKNLELLGNINHFFLKDQIPYKLMPGYVNFELAYSINGILQYLKDTASRIDPVKAKSSNPRDYISVAFQAFASYEELLAKKIVDFLLTKKSVTIIGSREWSQNKRVSTVSFVVKTIKSRALVEEVDKLRIGIRFGHFYAYRLIQELGLEQEDGIVRVSVLHYNTVEEVDRLLQGLNSIIPKDKSAL
eukprot:TRINITY_DN2439_c0_g1_i2.p1 TRINITY_DN2439_c0_g1~~TRINITY_DN2439_c0_g1_i2.p1  ORF type:complete len:434 (+),score=129.05 TRINITY_DN2439_c0_g1_i2:49-1350(+)